MKFQLNIICIIVTIYTSLCQFIIGMNAFMFTNDFMRRGTLFVFRDLTKLKVHFFSFQGVKNELVQKWVRKNSKMVHKREA